MAESKPKATRKTPAKASTAKAAAIVAPITMREQASDFAAQAKGKAHDAATQGKDKASDAVAGLSNIVEDLAKTLDEKVGAQYGDYARKAASTVSGFADTLKTKDVDDLVDDAREFVRQKPAVAIGAAAAVGFLLTRLFRAGGDE